MDNRVGKGRFCFARGWRVIFCDALRGCLYQGFFLATLYTRGNRVFREDLKVGDIGGAGSKLPGCHCGLRFGDFSEGTQFSPKVDIFINTYYYTPQALNHL